MSSKSLEELSKDLNVAGARLAGAVAEAADEVEEDGPIVVIPLEAWAKVEEERRSWVAIRDALLDAMPRAERLMAQLDADRARRGGP